MVQNSGEKTTWDGGQTLVNGINYQPQLVQERQYENDIE